VEQHVITNDYTFRHASKLFQIVREEVRPRMRGASLRVETRRNGEFAARFEDRYVRIEQREQAQKIAALSVVPKTPRKPRTTSKWMDGFWDHPAPSLTAALKNSNATS
jgi:hypothetical protein